MEQPKEKKVKKSNDTSSSIFTVNFEQMMLLQSTNICSKLLIEAAI